MRGLITWFVERLPFEPRSRRAIDETLLDWAHEEAAQTSLLAKSAVQIAGLSSILRVVAFSAVRETRYVPFAWLMVKAGLCGIVPSTIACVAFLWPLMGDLRVLTVGEMFAAFVPTMLVILAPPSVLLAIAWRADDRRIPAAGAVLLMSFAIPVLTTVVFPVSAWAFVTVYLRAIEQIAGVTGLSILHGRKALALDLGHLLSQAGPLASPIWWIGQGALAGACTWLGASLAVRRALRSMLWIVAVPAVYVTITGAISLAMRWLAPERVANAMASWLCAAVILALAAGVRQKHSQNS